MKLIRFVTLILVSSLIAGCNKTDPDQPVTQKTFDQAIKKFEKSEQEKIKALLTKHVDRKNPYFVN